MLRRTARLLAVAAVLPACGPALATSVINDADVAIARAHAAEGEKYALYETTLADLYLVKAKEEQGHAHYAEAQQLAVDALKMAEVASRKAGERRTAGVPPPMPTATVQRPDAPAPAPADKEKEKEKEKGQQPAPERKPKEPINPEKQ